MPTAINMPTAVNLTPAPQYTETVTRNLIIEALGGSQDPFSLLHLFPDALYHKTPESHLVRLMYILLGPDGLGQLQQNLLQARLVYEHLGLELHDLDQFYGDPFSFGRILDETYDNDTTGLLIGSQWNAVRASDSAYRSRALDFMGGARLGNSPAGMALVAQSGLGHGVDVIENYHYLYDSHSDQPKGVAYYGKTVSTEEMIVLPRHDVSKSETQIITIMGNPTGGYFSLAFNGEQVQFFDSANNVYTPNIPYDASALEIQQALERIYTIGQGQVQVTGGPASLNPLLVLFTGKLANQNVAQLQTFNGLLGGDNPEIIITTQTGGANASDEIVDITPQMQYSLVQALDRIKPLTTIPTTGEARGLRSTQVWSSVYATSEFYQVYRFVTGNPSVSWLPVDNTHFIEAGKENEAPTALNDQSQHYQGFHNIITTYAYRDDALSDPDYANDVSKTLAYRSEHIGGFGSLARVYPYFSQFVDPTDIFRSQGALASHSESYYVTSRIYPSDYAYLSGVPNISYDENNFWASTDRSDGADYLELDLGMPQAINFLAFEITRKPVDITVSFDVLDQSPARRFIDVTPIPNATFPNRISYSSVFASPWAYLEFNFSNIKRDIPFTRFVRIEFARRAEPFMPDQESWTVDVRNLRLGRNVN